jgi:hypothetical protein
MNSLKKSSRWDRIHSKDSKPEYYGAAAEHSLPQLFALHVKGIISYDSLFMIF